MPSVRIVGPGRAGTSLARALDRCGWRVVGLLGRHDDLATAAGDVDLCVIATPDAAVAGVAREIVADSTAVVAHLSGALGLDALAPHPRRASLHPLVSLPDADSGSAALAGGVWFAVAGDPIVRAIVSDLGGHLVEVAEDSRAIYHAAACIASNHTVALLAQVERVAADAGVPMTAYLELIRTTIDNVASFGPVSALTGPAARGDWRTVESHLRALDPSEAGLYVALAREAARLAGHEWPDTLAPHEAAPCA